MWGDCLVVFSSWFKRKQNSRDLLIKFDETFFKFFFRSFCFAKELFCVEKRKSSEETVNMAQIKIARSEFYLRATSSRSNFSWKGWFAKNMSSRSPSKNIFTHSHVLPSPAFSSAHPLSLFHTHTLLALHSHAHKHTFPSLTQHSHSCHLFNTFLTTPLSLSFSHPPLHTLSLTPTRTHLLELSWQP